MDVIQLPFWVIAHGRSTATPSTSPREGAGHAIAFSTTQALVAFLERRASGEWTIRSVRSKPDVQSLIADIRRDGGTGLCLDPLPDGSSGTAVTIDKLAG
jgi:hypothetical protein